MPPRFLFGCIYIPFLGVYNLDELTDCLFSY